MVIKRLAIALFMLAAATTAQAKHQYHEVWYQVKWCAEKKGITEVVLADRTRCDCLTRDHAIEFDFAEKWAEAIGQALYYSIQTGNRAGIVLIMEKNSDYRYWLRLNSVIQHNDLAIDTWAIGAGAPK